MKNHHSSPHATSSYCINTAPKIENEKTLTFVTKCCGAATIADLGCYTLVTICNKC